jgi:LytS/YehU family sensor histidine kinase
MVGPTFFIDLSKTFLKTDIYVVFCHIFSYFIVSSSFTGVTFEDCLT